MPTCSALSSADEPLPGTAAHAPRWVCLEMPSGWGRDVLDGAALGADLAAELSARADAAGIRLLFIRRAGRVEYTRARRTVLLANTEPGTSWCERLEIGHLADLLDLPLDRMSGPAPGIGALQTTPVALVCAHGKRDRCCAVLGRPVAAALAGEFGDAVWECSHTGGHRFAPSMIVLPTGYTYGRLAPAASLDVLRWAARGAVYPEGLRGRSTWPAAGQVAEIAVRGRESADAEELTVRGTTVFHADGRSWDVNMVDQVLEPRPASCGAASKPVTALVAVDVRTASTVGVTAPRRDAPGSVADE
ncbi:sucrase ferredoxin [Rhodococcus triatomae]|uniref:Sucrase ferredoxin n=1 Tax=Rhodococcus triatomae TaxID=300028 RepID=A0A1G8FQ47_9NOCA|nr:sucrase ferredoxin [Rhodococcus triatomae]QNG21424.1 sucrase ferredoxin [Rhodococcus triatomae]QNG25836.1 sucrase ferredoxin [Rhodococcus triatomae]SDH84219.1 hypothetical protein SAMN05444695_103355 [Rhodococcus triatomae]